MNLTEPDKNSKQDEELQEEESLLQKPTVTKILLGVIAVLLICVLILLTMVIGRREQTKEADDNLQQSITDDAKQQESEGQTIDEALSREEETYAPKEESSQGEEPEEEEETEDEEEEQESGESENDKTTVVVDIEDENDEAYTKDFILNEAYPIFADNRQDAMWDLAHLKRYVKLSRELEGTGEYYYKGDVDKDGKPDGTGLAIYEKNSYYFGQWSHGERSGQGTWFRYYINQRNKTNAMGVYMSHSYAGEWKNNLPNGQGAEHYDVDISKLEPTRKIMIQNVVGNFTDGLYDGDMYANTVDYIGNVQEWDGIASKGVFTLWRDMSAIGECSVWRYREDTNVCMDIDKSENKNQGIRELLK